MVRPIRLESLGDLQGRYDLWAHCEPCWRGRKLDLAALIARLGPGFPYRDLHYRLRCSICGSGNIGCQIVYAGGGFSYPEPRPSPT